MVNGHFFDPLAFLGIFPGRRFSYAFLMALFFHPGVVFLAILRKRWHRPERLEDAHLNPWTVNGFLFGVLTQQFYSYWTGGEFLG